MKLIPLFATVACLGLGSISGLAAQSAQPSETDQRLREVLERQDRLEAENAALRARIEGMAGTEDESALESQIAGLVAAQGGAVSARNATAIQLSGNFRTRTVWATVEPAAPPMGTTRSDEYDGYWTDALMRLGFEYSFNDNVSAMVQLQSHWGFGQGASTDAASGVSTPFGFSTGEANTQVSLYEAKMKVDRLFDQDGYSLTIGRQEVVLGREFQFGNADWYSGWSFDGFRADFGQDNWNLTALALKLSSRDQDLNQIHSALSAHDDDELYSLYFTMGVAEDFEFDAYWIFVNGHGEGYTGSVLGNAGAPGNAFFHTFGARFSTADGKSMSGLDFNGEFAYQTGSAGASDIDAFAFEGELGYALEGGIRVFARGLYATGADGNDLGYLTLFPDRHDASRGARYGLLDAFPMTNTLNLQAGFTAALGEGRDAITVGGTVMWATADEDSAGSNGDYGWTVDAFAVFSPRENLTFIAAAFAVFPDEELEALYAIEDDTIIGLVFQAQLSF